MAAQSKAISTRPALLAKAAGAMTWFWLAVIAIGFGIACGIFGWPAWYADVAVTVVLMAIVWWCLPLWRNRP